MEGEEIGLVLARASELRSKISDCVKRNGIESFGEREKEGEYDEDGDEGGGEMESLLGICDALQSLEQQLAALQERGGKLKRRVPDPISKTQALQQQQRYERDTILAQIDHSRRILLNKLRDYKGEDWEIIHEASAFAGETFDCDADDWAPLFPDNHYPSKLTKLAPNGQPKNPNPKATTPSPDRSRGRNGILPLLGWVAKSAITFLGVLSVLSLAGYKPVIRRNGTEIDADLSLKCPSDKLLVMESGVARCVPKKRVTAPFESGAKEPNRSYGSG